MKKSETPKIVPLEYVNCPTLKLVSEKYSGSPKSINDAVILMVEKKFIQQTVDR